MMDYIRENLFVKVVFLCFIHALLRIILIMNLLELENQKDWRSGLKMIKIKIDTMLDHNLQGKIIELYCDECEKWHSGRAGDCVGCEMKLDIEIEKEPTGFQKRY